MYRWWLTFSWLYFLNVHGCIVFSAEVEVNHRHSQVIITHAGNVSWNTHSIFRSSCSIDVTNFPFDRQDCHLWFGSWTHNSQEIMLNFAFPVCIYFELAKSILIYCILANKGGPILNFGGWGSQGKLPIGRHYDWKWDSCHVCTMPEMRSILTSIQPNISGS